MIRRAWILLVIAFLSIICTGCWDRREINDITLLMATSMDRLEDGQFNGTIQVVVPTRKNNTSSNNKPYFTESATGEDWQQIIERLQYKLSREVFIAHRRVFLIGEELAKSGLQEMLDHFGRIPTTRLRTYVLVVKGAQGQEALNTEYPLEFVPSEAIREMGSLLSVTAVTLRDFFIAASSNGVQPVMGAIELTPNSGKEDKKQGLTKTFNINHTAVFKDLKLVGYLNSQETQLMLWVTNKLKRGKLTVPLQERNQYVSVKLTQMKRRIRSTVDGEKVRFDVYLRAKGVIEENNGPLDLSVLTNLRKVENHIRDEIKDQTQQMLNKVQQTYGSDIFGFGEQLHKKDKQAWKKLSASWDETFKNAEIAVHVTFNVTRIGMTGPSLHLHEQEIIK